MPVKNRRPKRRATGGYEMPDWAADLWIGPTDGSPERREALREAWRHLGPAFMADERPGDRLPWAAREFGLPPGFQHTRAGDAD